MKQNIRQLLQNASKQKMNRSKLVKSVINVTFSLESVFLLRLCDFTFSLTGSLASTDVSHLHESAGTLSNVYNFCTVTKQLFCYMLDCFLTTTTEANYLLLL